MTGIVGRASELAALGRALDDAQDGRGTLLLVAGPAGIGKSRLASAAVDLASERGIGVATGFAVDDPGAPALWPWLRLMRGWPGVAELPSAEVGGSDAAARFQLFTTIADLVSAQASDGGLLVVLEDLHWADRVSIQLLRHLATGLRDQSIALLITYRDGVEGPLHDLLPDLVRGDVVASFDLPPLQREDIAAWLPELIGSAGHGDFATSLHERTGGNPLLVRLVAEDVARHGVDHLDDLMSERPQLRRLVGARVADLDASTRAVLEAASVLGERIAPHLLEVMVESGPEAVADALGHAVAVGVLRDGGPLIGLAFAHALVRDAVHAELAAPRRTELHRRAAIALEALREPTPAGSIAWHWQHVDTPEAIAQCQHWAQRADQDARRSLAYDDAVRYAELALRCAERAGVETAERAELLVRLAEAQYLANLIEASVRTCVEAADVASRAKRPDLIAAAGLVVHGVGDPFAYRTIPRICERALAELPPDAHATRARLHAQLAVGIAEAEGGQAPVALAAKAVDEAERSGDTVAILEALAARHLTISVPQTVAERLELGQRAIALGRSSNRPVVVLWGHLWRADAALQLGNITEADREIAEIGRVAETRGSGLARWHHLRYLALRDVMKGELAAARARNAAACELAGQMGDFAMIGLHFAFQVQLAIVVRDINEVGPGHDEMIAKAPPMPLVRVSRPLLHAIAGNTELARAEFEEFRELPVTFPLGVRWAPTVAQVGFLATILEDAEVAASVYERFAPLAHYYSGDGSGGLFHHGSIAGLVADCALTAGRVDAAVGHYRDAIAMNVRIGARPFTALSRLGLARALLRRADAAELAEAADLIAQAAGEFRRLEMRVRLDEALAVELEIAARRRTVSPLSGREAEVANLVAAALSNKQIADQLFLSERTVETHVRNILTKLALANRTEIATWAIRQR